MNQKLEHPLQHPDENSLIEFAMDPTTTGVDAHLRACADCQRKVSELRSELVDVQDKLSPLASAPISDDDIVALRSSVLTRLERFDRMQKISAIAARAGIAIMLALALMMVVRTHADSALWALVAISLVAATAVTSSTTSMVILIGGAAMFSFVQPHQETMAAAYSGFRCIGLEMVCGLTCGLANGFFARTDRSASQIAFAAAGGALVAQTFVHAGCPSSNDIAHTIMFHTAGVVLCLAMGKPVALALGRLARQA